MIITLRGAVEAGAGQSSTFVSLDWVRGGIARIVGFDPYPGTLNAVPTVRRRAEASWPSRADLRPPLPAPVAIETSNPKMQATGRLILLALP